MTFTGLTDDQVRELGRLSRLYYREAQRCEEGRAYLAGSIVLGSAFEALLMLMVDAHPDEAIQTGKVPTRNKQPRPLIEWDLSQLIAIAKEAGWLPYRLKAGHPWDGRKAKIGDYAEVTRMIRNLVHPGNYAREHSPSRVTAKYLSRQFEIVDLCRDWLAAHATMKLRQDLATEGVL